MAVKTFTTGEVLTASDANTYLANAGLVYVNSATFTAATTFDVTGFSTTYDSWRLVLRTRRVDTTGMGTFTAVLRTSATPITTGYYEGTASFSYLGTVASAYTRNNGADWIWGNSDSAAATSLWTYDLTGNSTVGMSFVMTGFSVGEAKGYNGGGSNGSTSAFDRIRVTFDYGTHTGTWALYGYRKA